MPFDYQGFEAELNALGETEVRAKYRRDEYLSHAIKNRFVQDWLQSFEDARRDAREAETLSIAKDANDIAQSQAAAAWHAARYAMYAAAIATTAALVASKDEIFKLIFGNP